MTRPYVICHMVTSIDGKVTGDFLSHSDSQEAIELYYEINRRYAADAYACGRITMEESFTGRYEPSLTEFTGVGVPEGDYVATRVAKFHAVAFDRRGRLGWKGSEIRDDDPGYDAAHIVEVLTSDVPAEHLAYLRSIGVSYIFTEKGDTGIGIALEKLYSEFRIKTLLLEGGSVINGAFLRAGLVDEISIVIAPVTSGDDGKPLFSDGVLNEFELYDSERHGNSMHIIYKKKAEVK